ncbi:hypothetical protein VPH35_071100 [Triticum aestivum]|uniref:Uncharacterized protein n=1 Tax=Triticum turgidum subsp. durum TaxID=4567 RepID=A0A9R0W6W6_TRITD|nr:unnamed protein product [Triticum turgidum subsp. durum]
MDDSALFMEWAMDTLEQEHPDPVVAVNGEAAFPSLQALCEQRLVFEELITGPNPASSGSSGETTDGSGGFGGNFSSPAAMEHDVWPPSPPTSASRRGGPPQEAPPAPGPCRRGRLTRRTISWRSGSDGRRLTSASSSSPPSSPASRRCTRRRSFPTQRGTSRSCRRRSRPSTQPPAAAAGASRPWCASRRSRATPPPPSSASSSTGNPLPEIEVRFSENGVMLRILCDDVQGVVVRVLAEVEEGLHLTVTHANVMPFTACTVIITITAKVDEGFTVIIEEIVGRLNSVLELYSSCTSTEEK